MSSHCPQGADQDWESHQSHTGWPQLQAEHCVGPGVSWAGQEMQYHLSLSSFRFPFLGEVLLRGSFEQVHVEYRLCSFCRVMRDQDLVLLGFKSPFCP